MTLAVRALALVLGLLGLGLLAGCTGGAGPDHAAEQPATATPLHRTGRPTSAAPTARTEPVTISFYDADFTVDWSGDLSVVETLTLDVSSSDRHGIDRYFDDGGAVEHFGATLDGAATPVARTGADGQLTFKIGDPDRTLARGKHVVRMEYGVRGVLDESAHGPEPWFDWRLIPQGWTLPIRASELRVHLPEHPTRADCTMAGETCDVTGLGSSTLVVRTGELGVQTPVELRAYRS